MGGVKDKKIWRKKPKTCWFVIVQERPGQSSDFGSYFLHIWPSEFTETCWKGFFYESSVSKLYWIDRWICWNMCLKEECSLQFDLLEGHFDRFFIAFPEGYPWVSSSQTKALWVYFLILLELLHLDAYSWSYSHIFGRRSILHCCFPLFSSDPDAITLSSSFGTRGANVWKSGPCALRLVSICGFLAS